MTTTEEVRRAYCQALSGDLGNANRMWWLLASERFDAWFAKHNSEPEEWEWGTVYEATGYPEDNVYEEAISEEAALSRVGKSPTDTGLVRRRAPGPWEDVG